MKSPMTYTIAITGKGGVGKTTVAALLIARLIGRGCKPVLAVDADPNSCLDATLGVKATVTRWGSPRAGAANCRQGYGDGRAHAAGFGDEDCREPGRSRRF